MKSIFRFFAERPLLAFLITFMIILLGITRLFDIKRSVFPHFEFGIMNIVTRYPGASPEDVELNVTNKIETELKTLSGIEQVTSISMENSSVIEVTIDPDITNQERVKTEIREAVARVTDLPDEVTESPRITEVKTSEMDVIEVGLSGDVPYGELREFARLFDKKLRKLPEVSRVDRFGYRAREIRVEVSHSAMAEYQISLGEIIDAIRSRNIQATSGTFESYTTAQDLVTLAQFRHPMEVGEVIVRSSLDGPTIKVKGLALIRDDFDEERVLSRMNGKSAISFLVYSSGHTDVIRTCEAVKELIQAEQAMLPEDTEIQYVNDESRYVRSSFKVVLVNGIMGLALVIIILPVFLGFHTAFWVALGIPVALLGTIFLLPQFGLHLDTIGLAGMILVLGIIVDDAIIISENITRRWESGDKPLTAAVEGLSDVFYPVLTTVLTTFLVFAPMLFMPGIMGKAVLPVPLAISLALFISLGESTLALPAHLFSGMGKRTAKSKKRNWFDSLSAGYKSAISYLLRFRYLLLFLFCIFLAGSLWYATRYMKFILFPTGTSEHVFIGIELPSGTSLLGTDESTKQIENIVSQLPQSELASYTTRIGYDPFLNAESQNHASISLNFTPYSSRSRSTDEIVEELRFKTDQIETTGQITYSIVGNAPPVGKPINLRIVGSDDMLRTQLADSVEVLLDRIQGVKDITRDDKRGKAQVEIKVDYTRLAQAGLTVADIAQNVRIAYDGEIVTRVRYGDEDVDFRVLIDEESRQQLVDVNRLYIPNRRGRLIPLAQVASLMTGPGQSDYRHYDGERTITLEADLDHEIVTPLEVSKSVLQQFDLSKDWPGMQLALGGELFETERSMAGLIRTFLVAIVAIYFLLVLLFNSFTQPLLVMVAIPFGIIGVIVTFAIHQEPLSFMAILGIIGLSGVVVNDSLVLVSYINSLRKGRDSDDINELVAEGSSRRLRAIILTTITTVAALVPLAYGLGGSAVFVAPIALALGWGLLFATPITLVLLPCLYTIGYDLAKVLPKKKA
ncbi:efflux RND transporter permease subunit [Candidatus Neomarinimicrobiota bacterium]